MVLIMGTLLFAACSNGGAEPDPTPAPSPDVARGETLYNKLCISCHGGSTGGTIRDIPPPHNANGHTWHHPDQQLANIILNGLDLSISSEKKMPAFKDELSDADVQAILAYIKTLWTDEQREFQATVTKQVSEN